MPSFAHDFAMPELTTSLPLLGLFAILSYLVGSVPFGIVMARIFNLGDLRAIGSGNIGATNVLRTGNKLAAFLTLVLDAGKGGMMVLLARWLVGEDAAMLSGLMAFIGHCFPIFLKFKGGKGVATYFGILFALSLLLGVIAGAIWLTMAALMRYSSFAALVTAGWTPVVAAFIDQGSAFVLLIVLALLIYARHWENIGRLRAGTESKIGK